jgi:hypothetical protein
MSLSFNPSVSCHYFNSGDATFFIFLYLREFCLNNYYYKSCKTIYVNKLVRERKGGEWGTEREGDIVSERGRGYRVRGREGVQ